MSLWTVFFTWTVLHVFWTIFYIWIITQQNENSNNSKNSNTFTIDIESPSMSNKSQRRNLSKHPILLLISFDGFRPDYITPNQTPNLHKLKTEGVSVPYMKNMFPTFTFPNHQSIATGLYVESHGIVVNEVYDPLYREKLNGYGNDPRFWNYSNQVIPLWILNEWSGDGRWSGVMMYPGSGTPYGVNHSLPTHRKTFVKGGLQSNTSKLTFEKRVDDILGWITHDEKPANLVFTYFDEPDVTGHAHGVDSEETRRKVGEVDDAIGYLMRRLEALQLTEFVNLILLSDHGMAPFEIQDDLVVKYEQILSSEDGKRYKQYGKTPLLQIMPTNQSETMEIYQQFKKAGETSGKFTAYLKKDLKRVKPHWHYSESRRIMPILLVADLGYVFEDFKRAKGHPYGVHSYENKYEEMHPFFMASGPLFKRGGVEVTPFENIDIFPLICKIMNIPAPGHNGTLSNILPILNNPRYSRKFQS